jgi:two-component system chemotaxis response regulator CheY
MPQITMESEGMNFPALPSELAKLNVLIAETDRKIALMVKGVLLNLGFQNIFVVYDGREALATLREHEIDIVFSEWQMFPMDGINFLRRLRRTPGSQSRMLPVIMLTNRGSQQDVIVARDSGINEYVIKPFTPKALLERIEWVIEKPRSFVLSRNYAGPDRRRVPISGEDSQGRPRIKPKIITKAQLQHLGDVDHPVMVMPDYELKKKVGRPINTIEIGGENLVLSRSEQAMRELQDAFIDWIAADMTRLRNAFDHLVVEPEYSDYSLDTIRSLAFSIRSRAATFGYTRASEVASLLYGVTGKRFRQKDPYHMLVVQKHIQTLATIFGFNMAGDGGEQGEVLMEELGRLIHKCL